jgi:hypothetical protein
MGKINCWEYIGCKKEKIVDDSFKEYCCVPFEKNLDGILNGKSGGRVCWGLIGTCCKHFRQKSLTEKLKICSDCKFYMYLKDDEEDFRQKKKQVMKKLMKRNQNYKISKLEMRDILNN